MNGDGQKVSEAYEEGAEVGAQSGQEGQERHPPNVGLSALYAPAERLGGCHAPASRGSEKSNAQDRASGTDLATGPDGNNVLSHR